MNKMHSYKLTKLIVVLAICTAATTIATPAWASETQKEQQRQIQLILGNLLHYIGISLGLKREDECKHIELPIDRVVDEAYSSIVKLENKNPTKEEASKFKDLILQMTTTPLANGKPAYEASYEALRKMINANNPNSKESTCNTLFATAQQVQLNMKNAFQALAQKPVEETPRLTSFKGGERYKCKIDSRFEISDKGQNFSKTSPKVIEFQNAGDEFYIDGKTYYFGFVENDYLGIAWHLSDGVVIRSTKAGAVTIQFKTGDSTNIIIESGNCDKN